MSDLLSITTPAAMPSAALCQQCSAPFEPRSGSGGKPQKYCSEDCRHAADAQRRQRGPTRSDETGSDDAEPTPSQKGPLGAVVSNGHELLLVPEDELRKVDRMADTPDDFDWGRDESVVIPEQQAVAVYWNTKNNLVIRQERTWDRDEDTFVIIDKGNAQIFLDKLCDVLGVRSAP